MTTEQTSTGLGDTYPTPIYNTLLERANSNEAVAEYLHETIATIGKYLSGTSAIPSINQICEVWMQASMVNLEDERNRTHLRSVLHLTTFLTQLKSNYEALEVNLESTTSGIN